MQSTVTYANSKQGKTWYILPQSLKEGYLVSAQIVKTGIFYLFSPQRMPIVASSVCRNRWFLTFMSANRSICILALFPQVALI